MNQFIQLGTDFGREISTPVVIPTWAIAILFLAVAAVLMKLAGPAIIRGALSIVHPVVLYPAEPAARAVEETVKAADTASPEDSI